MKRDGEEWIRGEMTGNGIERREKVRKGIEKIRLAMEQKRLDVTGKV